MSQEQFPQSEESLTRFEKGQTEGSFNKDAAAIQEALRYIDEAAPNWILEPTEVTIEQPANQEELIGNLDSMLGSQADGEQLQRHLQYNLATIKGVQEHHVGGGAVLDIKAGYNLDDIRFPGDNLTKEEYETLRDDSWPERETIDDPDQANVMVSGLLHATGAKVLRDDVSENGAIKRIYKGMLDGQPVYFQEAISPRIRGEHDPNRETKTFLERSFTVIAERTARHSLNILSSTDADVLRSIGVDLPDFNSPDYNPDTYPNRSRMIETLQLYAAMNPAAEAGQRAAQDATEKAANTDSEAIPEEPSEVLKKAQAERGKQEQAVISNFRAHGATEEQIKAYTDSLARMEEAELKRGRLFPHQAGFVRFEGLVRANEMEDIDMGIGSGFEQGDWVRVRRTSGNIDSQWTFMGVNKKTGLALVGSFDEHGRRMYKDYSLDGLKKLNSR